MAGSSDNLASKAYRARGVQAIQFELNVPLSSDDSAPIVIDLVELQRQVHQIEVLHERRLRILVPSP